MKRTAAREIAIQLGFAAAAAGQAPEELVEEFLEKDHYETMRDEGELYGEKPSKKDREFIRDCVVGVIEHRQELDDYIGTYAHGWRTERISRTAAAVLRQAMYEILYMPDIPDASSMNEAVELLKGYEDQEVVSFVNGVLGGFYRQEVLGGAEPAAAAPAEDAEAPEPETLSDD